MHPQTLRSETGVPYPAAQAPLISKEIRERQFSKIHRRVLTKVAPGGRFSNASIANLHGNGYKRRVRKASQPPIVLSFAN